MDTRKIELKKIIKCLKQNGYDFKGLAETDKNGSKFAIFKKDIPDYDDEDGNYIDDRFIEIEIEFDSDIVDGIVYDDDLGSEFIQNIFDTSGGSRKRSIKRKKTTRRNRKTKK